jgi:hypothetical protein
VDGGEKRRWRGEEVGRRRRGDERESEREREEGEWE